MSNIKKTSYDVIIVGGGAMGCSIAYNLINFDNNLDVAIIEKDPTYSKASTLLSEGNIRVQFNVKENIEISLFGIQFLSKFSEKMAVLNDKPDVNFRQQGNLFVVDKQNYEEAKRGFALQKNLGCQVEWLNPDQIHHYYPYYNLSNCLAATYGSHDGTITPSAVLAGYKNKAISLGVNLVTDTVSRIMTENDHVNGVELDKGHYISSKIVVNAAGAWAPIIASTADINLPIVPVKRQVTVIDSGLRPTNLLPVIFFSSGLYCFHEGQGVFTCARSRPNDLITYDDFNWDSKVFYDSLWSELLEVIPEFDRLKVKSGWAGLYAENTFDGNAILGEWPNLKGFFLANGFSGHGLQQCHAVGRYIAELILHKSPAIDLSIFSPKRIIKNKPVYEGRSKII
tara:strand:- start:5472 stop:6662 length:1191 start_codon:yes stop_codon:yes gene_type:complete